MKFTLDPSYHLNASWQSKIRFALLHLSQANTAEISSYLHEYEPGRHVSEINAYVVWNILEMDDIVALRVGDSTVRYSLK